MNPHLSWEPVEGEHPVDLNVYRAPVPGGFLYLVTKEDYCRTGIGDDITSWASLVSLTFVPAAPESPPATKRRE